MPGREERALRKYMLGATPRFRWRRVGERGYEDETDVPAGMLTHDVASIYSCSNEVALGPRFYEVVSYLGTDGCSIAARWHQDFLEYIYFRETDPYPMTSAFVIAPSGDFHKYSPERRDDPMTYAAVCARVLEALGQSRKYAVLIVFDADDPKLDELCPVLESHGIPCAYDSREILDSVVEKGSIRPDAAGVPIYHGPVAKENERTVAASCLIWELSVAASQWAPVFDLKELQPAFPEGVLSAVSLGHERRSEENLLASIRVRDKKMSLIACNYDPSSLASSKGCSRLVESTLRVRDLRRLWCAYAGTPTLYGKDAVSAARFGYESAMEKGLRRGLQSAVDALYEGVPVEDILAGGGGERR